MTYVWLYMLFLTISWVFKFVASKHFVSQKVLLIINYLIMCSQLLHQNLYISIAMKSFFKKNP